MHILWPLPKIYIHKAWDGIQEATRITSSPGDPVAGGPSSPGPLTNMLDYWHFGHLVQEIWDWPL